MSDSLEQLFVELRAHTESWAPQRELEQRILLAARRRVSVEGWLVRRGLRALALAALVASALLALSVQVDRELKEVRADRVFEVALEDFR